MNGSAELDKLFEQYLNSKLKERKRFELEELEMFLIKKIDGMSAYQSAGGYQALYQLLREKEEKGEIKAIKSSPYNGRQPLLKSRWQLVVKNTVQSWEDQLIFQLSRQLDLRYYLKKPWLQTEELAEKLLRLAEFLSKKNSREWSSREERSLELFADEKFLSTAEGKKLLSSLNLNLAVLKAEKYSQMFVYWNKGTMIKKILILENHSAFIACKRALTADYNIFSYAPDTLIYGEGKHIIESFKFLNELLAPLEKENRQQVEIKYAGDIDPEG
ncbi:MAG: cytosolic protein [Firmicutes bacterium]|nr:cytosolic protein [Bacillota bacterium]